MPSMTKENKYVCFYEEKFKDYRGVPISLCWSEKLWFIHVDKHPEIMNPEVASRLISEAIMRPSLVVTGQRPGNSKEPLICYYKEHKSSGSNVYYSKVVIGCRGSELYVKTVFMGWAVCMYAVQEKKYNFKELYREEKTIL